MNEQEKYDWMVYVSCMTYNHAPYIVDAMNGFTMQETNFPFVCAVVDDASTDGEQEVIRNYLNEHFNLEDKKVARHEETDDYVLTFAQHKTNLNCYFSVFYLKYNHYKKKTKAPYLAQWRLKAKYLAICEGDDYWIHPRKLQIQVDYLETHSEYSMCFHAAEIFVENKCISKPLQMGLIESREYSASEIYDNWIVPTASIVRRSKVHIIRDNRFAVSDLVVFLSCAKVGKIYAIGEKMSVYRRHEGGASVTRMSYIKNINHHLGLREHFPEIKDVIDSHIVRKYVSYLFDGWHSRILFEIIFSLLEHPKYIIPSLMYSFSLAYKRLYNSFIK